MQTEPAPLPNGFMSERNGLSQKDLAFLAGAPEYERIGGLESHCGSLAGCVRMYRDEQGGAWCRGCNQTDTLITAAGEHLPIAEDGSVGHPPAPANTAPQAEPTIEDLAAKLKAEMAVTLNHQADLMNAAKALGLDVSLTLGPDAQGKIVLSNLSVRKEY